MKIIVLLLVLIPTIFTVHNILSFGAIPQQDTLRAHFANQQALKKAYLQANATKDDRVVLIPAHKFYSMPVRLENVHNITLQLVGKWSASKNVKLWPFQPNSDYFQDFISFHDSNGITITGGGKIDGRGYHWWVICILNLKKLLPNESARPHLIRIQRCRNISIHDIIMKNSAQFHLKMDQCYDAKLYNIHIKVNTTAQINLFKKFSLQGILVLFPLNTDGIDPHGARMHIYNLTVQNFDDVVVPKPGTKVDMGATCTQDMLVENCTVVFGVGMTIGSVPPNINVNCIRNITFRNVIMKRPIKGIYVKTNPGDYGTGIIQNIYYSNFTMDRPIWWAVYIGPQQMKQPDGDGPGCMLYPYDPKGECVTQPRITIRNITLDKVSIHKSFLFPVIIRCNSSNPCKQITISNFKVDKWQHLQKKNGYVCQNAQVILKNSSLPITCKDVPNININNQLRKQSQNSITQQFNNFSPFQKLLFLDELQKAALQIGYQQEDDEFDYNIQEQIKQWMKEQVKLVSQ